MICPKCKQNRAHRAERAGVVDHALNRMFFKPWFCQACTHRFYALREDLTPNVLRLRIAGRLPGSSEFRKNKKRNRREMYIYGLAAMVLAYLIYSLMQQHTI